MISLLVRAITTKGGIIKAEDGVIIYLLNK